MLLGKPLFNFINTGMFFCLCLLISVHALGKFDKKCLWIVLPVISAFFMYTPYFAEDFLWVSGACNYVVSAILMLLYLLPYRLALNHSEKKGVFAEILLFLAMTVFGCIAGNTMENSAFALIACTVAFLILFRIRCIKYRLWMFSPGIFVGLAFVLFSPGELARIERGARLNIISMIKNAAFTSIVFVISFYAFIIILCVVLYIFFSRRENRSIRRFFDFGAVPLVYLMALLTAEYSLMVVDGGIGMFSRAWFIPFVFLLIFTVCTLFTIRPLVDTKILKPAFLALSVFVIVSLVSSFQGLTNVKNRYSEYQRRENIISKQINAGEKIIKIPAISSSSRYSIYFNGGEILYYGENKNAAIARYYGVSDIIRDDSIELK